MSKASRAIIFKDEDVLVMHRYKNGNQYYTLVGGHVNEGESLEDAIVREVKEETGLDVTESRHVYTELHSKPDNEQYIFLCKIASDHQNIAIQHDSEEAALNSSIYHMNKHTPRWVSKKMFSSLPFRSPQLQQEMVKSFKKKFPDQPITL